MEKDVINKIKTYIDKKQSVETISKELNLETYQVYGLVYEMINAGELYDIIDGNIIKLPKPIKQNDVYTLKNNLKELKLLLLSDTHLASKYDRLDIIRYLYKKAEDRGVKYALHSGDFTDGRSNRPEQVYELKKHSYEDQIKYCVDKYPESNINTYFISGNHDDWWYKSAGSDICKAISRDRKDLIYLGPDVADMKIGNLKIRMFHGKGGIAYAKSYKIQKYLDTIPVNEKPDILQTGHIHQAFYYKQDQTHCFQTGCLEDQTPFCRGLGLSNDKSVWWVNVKFDDKGNIISITPELESFDKKLIYKK